MTKSPSQVTAIGIFVLSAIILTVAMLMAFGGGKWNRATVKYRMYFNSSVKGLSVGSPVMFRGVNIGQVTSIALARQAHRDPNLEESPNHKTPETSATQNISFPIEVHIEIDPVKLGYKSSWLKSLFRRTGFGLQNTESLIKQLVLQGGLRAQLQSLSLLTGQLYIEMNFEPIDDGIPHEQLVKDFNQGILPTQLSMMEKMLTRLGRRDFSSQLDSIYELFVQLSTFIDSGKSDQLFKDISAISANLHAATGQVNNGLPQLLSDAKSLLTRLNTSVEQLTSALNGTIGKVDASVNSTHELVTNINTLITDATPDVKALLKNLNQTLSKAQTELDNTHALILSLRDTAAPDSPLQSQLNQTLKECESTAANLRTFLEYLNRNPQALLLGR